MRNIGSSNKLFASSIALQGQYSFRGPTGPTGNTGPSSTLGNTGSTGNTGAGLILIGVNYPDGLSLYLDNGLIFDVSGVSGNTATQTESRDRSVSLGTGRPLTFTSTTTSFGGITISGGPTRQTGLTLQYTNFYGKGGISLYYSGDNLVFHGVTTANVSLGPTGSVLGAFGNTAFGLIDAAGNPVFKYTEITSGITTGHVISGVLNQFIQTKNTTGITNINLLNTGSFTDYLKQIKDTSFYDFIEIKTATSNVWTSRLTYNTSYSGITTTAGTTSGTFPSRIFRTDQGDPPVKYGKRKMGSCCYCDQSGKKRCIDYTTENYCVDYIDGTFLPAPCSERRSADCDDWGACCLPGRCVDTTRALCVKFGGNFKADRLCSQNGACL
jgi:hypothetical protein